MTARGGRRKLAIVDNVYMSQFGSVFNGCCRVSMPRHRQEGMYTLHRKASEEQFERALDVAYQDVRAASATGRPPGVAGSA